MGEFPLVLFTVLSQLAAGALITLVILDYVTGKIDNSLGKKSTLAILIITGTSLLFSLFHLGHPLEAYRALTNIGSSWLSREVVLFAILFVLLLVYYFQWKEDNSKRKTVGLIASLIAVMAVIASGMVYVLPAVPAWNNFSPVIFFVFTAAVLGPLFVFSLLKLKGGAFSSLLYLPGIILGASLVCFIIYTSVLISSPGPSGLTGSNMLESSTFWLRIFLNWLIPLGLLVWASIRKSMAADSKFIIGLFLLVFVGEIVGRHLFYNSAVILRIAGL